MLPEESEFLESLYREQASRLHRYAIGLLNAGGFDASLIPDLAEELVQDTFHTAAKRISDLTSHPKPAGWLFKTLQYKFNSFRRQFYADSQRLLFIEDLPKPPPSPSGNPSSVLADMEYADALSLARQSLSEEDFLLFDMVALNHTSHKVAAQRLGITVWASQQRLSRIRRELKKKYFKEK